MTYRFLLVAAVALGVLLPPSAQADDAREDKKETYEAHLEELGYRKEKDPTDRDEVICKRQRRPGSAMTTKVCRTREQWEYITHRSQESAGQL